MAEPENPDAPGCRRVFYGWWVVVLAGLVWVLVSLPGGIISVWASSVRDQFFVHEYFAGLLLSVMPIPVLAGFVSDRIGPRKTILVSLIVLSAFVILSALTRNAWIVYGSTLMAWAGISLSGHIPVMTIVGRWFVRRRATAVAVAHIAGYLIGAVLFIPYFATIYFGYFNSLSDSGLPLAVVALTGGSLIVACFALTRLRNRPEDLGLLPDGDLQLTPQINFTLRQALRQRSFWFIVVGGVLAGAGVQATLIYLALAAFDRDFAQNDLSSIITLLGLYSLTSAGFILVGGFAGDRVPRFAALAFFTAFGAVGQVVLAFAGNLPLLYLAVIALGIGSGGRAPVAVAILADYFGMDSFGKILGLSVFFVGLAGQIAQVLVGWILDAQVGHTLPFMLLAGLSLLGTFCFLKARPPQLLDTSAPQTKPDQEPTADA